MSEGRFTTLTTETMTPEQKRVAEAIQSGPRGAGLRGPFNALLRSPELCDLVQRVGAFVRFGTSIPARVNELAIIMAGRKWTAQYELYAHRRLAIEAGLEPAIADAIAAGTRPSGMAEDEATGDRGVHQARRQPRDHLGPGPFAPRCRRLSPAGAGSAVARRRVGAWSTISCAG